MPEARYLLDTNAFVWLALDPSRVRAELLDELESPETTVVLSAVVSWELAVKQRMGKLAVGQPLEELFRREVEAMQLDELAVTRDHALATGRLPDHHRDPFDRLLVAQALTEDLDIVSSDPLLARYGVAVVW